MGEDDESRARVEMAAEKITHHIVDHSEIAEEEENNKKRQKQSPPKTKSPGRSPGGDAGKMTDDADATAADASRRPANDPLAQRLRTAAAKMMPVTPTLSKNKRRAEDSPDDPRKDDGEAEVA